MQRDGQRREIEARLKSLTSQQEERLARHRAGVLRLPYIDLVVFPMDVTVLGMVPRDRAQAAGAVLFYKKGNDVRMGAINPKQEVVTELLKEVAEQIGVKPQVYVISQHSLVVALSRYPEKTASRAARRDIMLISQERLGEFEKNIQNFRQLGQRIVAMAPTEILTTIVAGAIRLGASDIHVEPRQEGVILRYRVDGVLQNITEFAREGWRQILSRVKVLAELKLNVKDVPQDGSFVLQVNGDQYDVRASILPGAFGENIVMRLFSRQKEGVYTLSELGMKPRDIEVVRGELKQSTGMILAAGPTGSGKTTTIVACLREVNKPELKIISLEDPVEYRIAGVEQTEVDEGSGYTMAVGLRSILRQDPDIIFVGEMRDVETAETSIHAAMTGHLVFSTIHANDAPGVILRAVGIGVQPYVLAPALNVIIAQRLVRVVCRECREEYEPGVGLRQRIAKVMAGVTPEIFNPRVLDRDGLKFAKAKGCKACGGTGYRGRVGVFEVFAVKGGIEELILQEADSSRIKAAAQKAGMTTIAQDAYLKVIEKITTVEEVERISEE
ncbi:MAG: GspE/PulE family protein [bacterium]